MRISDWSSDVCSSDLQGRSQDVPRGGRGTSRRLGTGDTRSREYRGRQREILRPRQGPQGTRRASCRRGRRRNVQARSEERRVGKSVSVRVDLGGSRSITKKIDKKNIETETKTK